MGEILSHAPRDRRRRCGLKGRGRLKRVAAPDVTERDRVGLSEDQVLDPRAVDECSILASQIGQNDGFALNVEARVRAREALVAQAEVVLPGATDCVWALPQVERAPIERA